MGNNGNGKTPKAKAKITVYLLDDGNIAMEVSSSMMLTNIGLLEAGKQLLISGQSENPKEEGRIIVPKQRFV